MDYGLYRQFRAAFCVFPIWFLSVNCCKNSLYDGDSQSARNQGPGRGEALAETKVVRPSGGKREGERKVKEYLDKELSRGGWTEIVRQVFQVVEKVYKVQNGKKGDAGA